jgi:phage baseplate assembly protein W
MTRNTRLFSDLDLNFTANPVTKDISRRYDDSAIKTSLKNLILTSNYERPFHSEIGSPLKRLLFEPQSPVVASSMRKSIIDMINSFEPRVEVIDVIVNYKPNDNGVDVTINFKVINTERPITLNIVLERTR